MDKNELNFEVYSYPSIVILYRYRKIQKSFYFRCVVCFWHYITSTL